MTVYYQKQQGEAISLKGADFRSGDFVVICSPQKLYRFILVGDSQNRVLDSVVFDRSCQLVGQDSILFQYDPILGRRGNTRMLKWMTSVFQRPEVNAFFEESVKICTFKESRWDAKVLADIYSLSPIPEVAQEGSPMPTKSTRTFLDFLGESLRQECIEMISKGMKRSAVFRHLKNNHPREFSSAFKAFKKENPEKTIFDIE
jgi:hypothetical protein